LNFGVFVSLAIFAVVAMNSSSLDNASTTP
jgi:hypothetical protein